MTKLEKLFEEAHQFTREEFNSGNLDTEDLRDEIFYRIKTNRNYHDIYTRIKKSERSNYKGPSDRLFENDYDDYCYIHLYTLIGRTIVVDYGCDVEYTNNRWDHEADEWAGHIACEADHLFLDVPGLYHDVGGFKMYR